TSRLPRTPHPRTPPCPRPTPHPRPTPRPTPPHPPRTPPSPGRSTSPTRAGCGAPPATGGSVSSASSSASSSRWSSPSSRWARTTSRAARCSSSCSWRPVPSASSRASPGHSSPTAGPCAAVAGTERGVPTRQLHLPAPPARVAQSLDQLRAELGIPVDLPPAALAEAQEAARRPLPALPDARDLPLVTVDPPGSRDLDQAVHLEEDGEGFLVHYAIADVASFVTPGGALDAAVHERGVTVYGPTGSTPLHPEVLSAGAASLLPDQDRPAYLWRIALGADGAVREASVRRALVRSRAQLTYGQVQDVVDGGSDPAVPPTLP